MADDAVGLSRWQYQQWSIGGISGVTSATVAGQLNAQNTEEDFEEDLHVSQSGGTLVCG